jgi:alkylated DNA repair dioxygenase AlkB
MTLDTYFKRKADEKKKTEPIKIYNLSVNATTWYHDNFLDFKTQKLLYDHLLTDASVKWQQGMYGDLKLPRLLWSMKDEKSKVNKQYRQYTGTGASAWTESVLAIKLRIEKEFNTKITYCQLNYYRNGTDYIGFHRDKELMPGDCVYSLSLGCERTFCLRTLGTKVETNILLHPGSLLIMNYAAGKDEFEHSLKKEPRIKNGRINITFRVK